MILVGGLNPVFEFQRCTLRGLSQPLYVVTRQGRGHTAHLHTLDVSVQLPVQCAITLIQYAKTQKPSR